MKSATFIHLLLLLVPMLAGAATPRAWLDRDSIRLGETVTLNVEVEGMASVEPDFSVLDPQFQRLGVSSRSQMSLVNGQRSSSTLWAVALEPREAGVFTVPAVPVGGDSTAPVRLTVLPALAAAAGDDVFLEVEATPQSPYVQQQVRYRIKLYYGVTLLDGQLEEPVPSGAELRRLGNDLSYQTQIGDRRYNVVERRFALIPEASGELVIPAVRFRGRAMGGAGRFGPGLSSGRQVSANSEPIRLQVRANPVGIVNPWLPAAQLELTAPGEPWPDTVPVGEPLSIELRLAARGIDGARLPELTLPAIEGVDVYPDQPVMRSAEDGEWLQGERRQRFALVPQRPGEVVLPEVSLAWWNTETDRAETVSLPARRIRVLAASASVDAPRVDGTATEGVSAASGLAPVWPWQALSAALLAVWLTTLLLWWRQRGPRAGSRSIAAPEPASMRQVRGAIQRHSPQDFEAALLAVVRRSGHPIGGLADLRALLDDSAQRDALERYQQARWRAGDIDWRGLASVFAAPPRVRAHEASVPQTAVLPPLYPDHAQHRVH